MISTFARKLRKLVCTGWFVVYSLYLSRSPPLSLITSCSKNLMLKHLWVLTAIVLYWVFNSVFPQDDDDDDNAGVTFAYPCVYVQQVCVYVCMNIITLG